MAASACRNACVGAQKMRICYASDVRAHVLLARQEDGTVSTHHFRGIVWAFVKAKHRAKSLCKLGEFESCFMAPVFC